MMNGNKCHQKKKISWLPVEILSNSFNTDSHAQNLRVTFDADFNFQHHINNTVKFLFISVKFIISVTSPASINTYPYMLPLLYQMPWSAPDLTFFPLLLHSAPVTNLDNLQRVQNSLARVVTKSPRLTSSRPLLSNLNWLLIYSCLNFKPHHYVNLLLSKLPLPTPALKILSNFTAPLPKVLLARLLALTVWNHISFYIQNATNVSSFRTQLIISKPIISIIHSSILKGESSPGLAV